MDRVRIASSEEDASVRAFPRYIHVMTDSYSYHAAPGTHFKRVHMTVLVVNV